MGREHAGGSRAATSRIGRQTGSVTSGARLARICTWSNGLAGLVGGLEGRLAVRCRLALLLFTSLGEWRVQSGPDREAYFEQVAVPGREAALDFSQESTHDSSGGSRGRAVLRGCGRVRRSGFLEPATNALACGLRGVGKSHALSARRPRADGRPATAGCAPRSATAAKRSSRPTGTPPTGPSRYRVPCTTRPQPVPASPYFNGASLSDLGRQCVDGTLLTARRRTRVPSPGALTWLPSASLSRTR